MEICINILFSCFDCKNVLFSELLVMPCECHCVACCTARDQSQIASGSGLSTSSTYVVLCKIRHNSSICVETLTLNSLVVLFYLGSSLK